MYILEELDLWDAGPELVQLIISKGLYCLLILIIGLIVMSFLTRLARRALTKSQIDKASHTLIIRIVRIIISVLIFLSLLACLGVDMMPIVTVLGAGGVAIALALRDSLANVAGGIIMIVTKPFSQGDEVEVEGLRGYVDEIDLMTTHLHKYDNTVIVVPNSKACSAIIVNYTARDVRSVICPLTLGYDTDTEKVKSIMNRLAEEEELFLTEPAPYFYLKENGADGIDVLVYMWCKTPDRYKAETLLRDEMRKKLLAEGVDIAYPHMTVDVNKG